MLVLLLLVIPAVFLIFNDLDTVKCGLVLLDEEYDDVDFNDDGVYMPV